MKIVRAFLVPAIPLTMQIKYQFQSPSWGLFIALVKMWFFKDKRMRSQNINSSPYSFLTFHSFAFMVSFASLIFCGAESS